MYAGLTALLRASAIRLGAPQLSAAASSPNRLARTQTTQRRLGRRCLHLSTSTARSAAAAAEAKEETTTTTKTSKTSVKPTISHSNLARNREIRYAFRDRSPETDQAVEEMLGTAYIPPARRYPAAESTALSLRRAQRIARVRVGEEMLARKGGRVRRRDAADTFGLLKRMTQPRGQKPAMHAMRIVLPKAWEFDVASGKSVDFVEARTGLAARLRMTGDRENATAIVLRGQSPVLAKAADELVAVCKDVEIFKLGEVTSFDYAAQRLWPVIAEAEDDGGGGAFVPAGRLDSIWIHKEQQYWIDSAYEKTPRPQRWTAASFEGYITSLVYGRLRPGRTLPLYNQGIHTDGIRVRMIMDAFEDPAARSCITTPVLKMALQFMSTHGGYQARAERLLSQAEKWGVPLDTDAFNILLDCYVYKHDVRYFHKVLVKMRERCFYPNTRTWLHFLQLVQRDDVRLQVEAAMFDLGFFEDPGTRRGVSTITAGTLAYQAFRAGETLPAFVDKQLARFGPAWLAVESTNAVLREFFLFHPTADRHKRYHDYRVLFDRLAAHGKEISSSTLNIVLEHCAQPHVRDWDTALWALDRMSLTPQDAVGQRAARGAAYHHLVDLCVGTRSATALGAVVFYAVKERSLFVRAARTTVAGAILSSSNSSKDAAATTGAGMRSPRLMTGAMASALQKVPVEAKAHAVRAVEAAIRDATMGYTPADTLVDTLRAARRLDEQHETVSKAKTTVETAAETSIDEPAVTISLVTADGEAGGSPQRPERIEARLDSIFDVRRMVVYNQDVKPPWVADKKKKSPKSAESGTTRQKEDENTVASTTTKEGDKKSGHHPLVQYLNSLH